MNEVRISRRWWIAVIAVAALAVYANTLANAFAYDDVPVIHDDPRVHGLHHLAAIFGRPYWVSYGRELGLYRPLTTLAFALQWTASGGAPWFFHAISIALHAGVCVLAFLLLERLAGRASGLAAGAGALLFAVHPVHTEAVANLVGQAELLAALGCLAALLVWTRRPERGAASVGTVAGVAAAYALALFAKESAIALPALLVAVDLAQKRIGFSRRALLGYLREAAPAMLVLVVVAGGYLAARQAVLGAVRGGDIAPSIPFIVRDHFWVGLRAWPEYARLLFFPQDLSSDYSPAVILPVQGWEATTLLGGVLLLATAGLALLTPVRPGAGLPAAWFLLSILVVSNLFFPIGVVLAERTLYLPSLALSLALAFAWPALRRRYPPALVGAAGVVALLALAARTWARNPDWRDQEAVVAAMVRDHPESYRSQWNTAVRAFARHDTAAAARAWELTYRLWPEDSHMLAEFAAYNIAIDRPARALEVLQQARALHAHDPRTEEMYATALIALGRCREAIAVVDTLGLTLGNAPALDDLRARAYMGLHDFPAAVAAWRRVVTAYPATWVQWSGYGRSLARTGDFAGALAAFDTARTRARRDTAALREIEGFRALTLGEAGGVPRRVSGAPIRPFTGSPSRR